MHFPVLHSTDHSDCIPETPRISKQFDSLPWEPTRPQDKAYFWERIEAPLPPLRPRPKCNFTHPRQLSPFPERQELPFSSDEILFGYEEIDSSGTDQFTAWIKMSEHEILVQHVNINHMEGEQGWVMQGVLSRASFRRPPTSGQKYFAVLSLHISNIYAEKKRDRQEAHSYSSCHHDFSRI